LHEKPNSQRRNEPKSEGKALFGTLKVLKLPVRIAHRAFLAIGEPESPVGNEARFPIENYGHTAGLITSIDMEVIIKTLPMGKNGVVKILRKASKKL
jgi:hypothetical protein